MSIVPVRMYGKEVRPDVVTIPAGETVTIELLSYRHYYGPKIDYISELYPNADRPREGPQPEPDRPGTLQILGHKIIADGSGVEILVHMDEKDAVALLQITLHSTSPDPYRPGQEFSMNPHIAFQVSTRPPFEQL